MKSGAFFVVAAAAVMGAAGLFMAGCERSVQGSDTNTDYTDNSRFSGTYTGTVSGAAGEIAGGIEGVVYTDVIGSDASRKDQIFNQYFYIPASGSYESFSVSNSIGGFSYTEQISINGSTLSFHITRTDGGENTAVFDFYGDYSGYRYTENYTDQGVPSVVNGYFTRATE